MRLTLEELDTPMKSSDVVYTDFDPEAAGFVRQTNGAVKTNKMYSASDLTLNDSLRNVYRSGAYYAYIKVPLNKEYIDKDGNKFPVPVKVGDKVIYSKYGGTEVSYDGEDVLILRADDIYAICE